MMPILRIIWFVAHIYVITANIVSGYLQTSGIKVDNYVFWQTKCPSFTWKKPETVDYECLIR